LKTRDVNVGCVISMISEGSCNTEDWSNDAENSALHHRSKLHFNMQLDNQFFLYF